MAFPRDRVWPWIVAAILSALIFIAMVVLWPAPAHSAPRSQQHWGGSDLPVSCATVREWRRPAGMMSRERRRQLEREFNVTPKWRRQAYACLKGK
jgi:hypothetical protein